MLAIFVISYRRKEEEPETADVGILHKDAKLEPLIRKRGELPDLTKISRSSAEFLEYFFEGKEDFFKLHCANHLKKKSQNHST